MLEEHEAREVIRPHRQQPAAQTEVVRQNPNIIVNVCGIGYRLSDSLAGTNRAGFQARLLWGR